MINETLRIFQWENRSSPDSRSFFLTKVCEETRFAKFHSEKFRQKIHFVDIREVNFLKFSSEIHFVFSRKDTYYENSYNFF